MRTIIHILGYLPLCLVVLCSCSKEQTEDLYNSDDNSIYIDADQNSLEFTSDDHFTELRFSSNFWWTMDSRLIVETDDYEQSDWFSVTPTENFGSRPVMVSLTRNIEKHPRKVVLSFQDKNSSEVIKELTITQQASEPFLELNETYKDFSVLGGKVDVRVTTSEIWNITAPEWCVTGFPGGDKGKEIVVSFDIPRYTGADREGEISFVNAEGNVTATYTVKQAGTFISPAPVVANGEDFVVSWDKPYGAVSFKLNFYSPAGEKVADREYIPKGEESACSLRLTDVEWGGYVGPVEVRLETFLAPTMSQESVPTTVYNHNLFDDASGTGGSADSPCRISNPRHFQNINRSLAESRYYLQVADIDLSGIKNNSFVPVGTGTAAKNTPFTGTYDGGGKSLKNLTCLPDNKANVMAAGDGCAFTFGVFGYVQGTVKNVVLDNVVMGNDNYKGALSDMTMAYVGLLVGTLDGMKAQIDNCTVRNCKFTVAQKIASTNDNFVFGSLVGRIIGGCTVKNCVDESMIIDIRKGARIGGVVGAAPKTNSVNTSKIMGCMNIGGEFPEPETVNVTPVTGGIVGVLCHESSVSDCTNYARVKTGMESGGIAGRMENNAVMEQCANYGRVSGICNANKAQIGGLVGSVASKIGEEVVVRRSFNAGAIENRCEDKGANQQYIGGIAGNNQGRLQNCYHVGTITMTTLTGSEKGAEVYIGGVFGLAGNDPKATIAAKVENCYGAGMINALSLAKVGIVAGATNKLSTASTVAFFGVYGDKVLSGRTVGDRDQCPEGIIPLTTEQMKNQTNFTGWDFLDVWVVKMTENQGYPSLVGVPVVKK